MIVGDYVLVISFFFFSSRRRHTRFKCDWSSDVCSSDLWNAKKGRDVLTVTWDEGPNAQVSSASISQLLAQRADDTAPTARHDGDPDTALARAASPSSAHYELPLLAHATMEPQNSTATRHTDR